MKTYVPKLGEVKQEWHVIDATDQILGRVAVEAARLIRGKHKPVYTPFLDCGDHVIVINADKVRVTGKKVEDKIYYHHSQYPGGLSETSYGAMAERHPGRAMELAIKGMLPHNRLGRKLATHFRVYAGPDHEHIAQNPKPYEMPVKSAGKRKRERV